MLANRVENRLGAEAGNMQFENKVAIVTGGNSGIGRAAALAFAREGAKVVIAARNRERGEAVVREIREAGGDALFVPTDVSKSADVKALVGRTVTEYGRVDCAFNNAAGYGGVFSLTADFSEQEFDETIAVDLKGVWLCMKYEIRQMLAQNPPGGAIVNTSSVNGLGGIATGAIYSAAKAGVIGLTKSAAQEYARQGIRVNALVAGAFRTPMLEHSMERAANGNPELKKQVEGRYLAFIPSGRIGDAGEAADAAVWMCSDAASYLTGHSLIVDGGMTSLFR
jgi:NAD(P)-dependent dehydrogenase (short-subunit alcohol dehydrogenase family)